MQRKRVLRRMLRNADLEFGGDDLFDDVDDDDCDTSFDFSFADELDTARKPQVTTPKGGVNQTKKGKPSASPSPASSVELRRSRRRVSDPLDPEDTVYREVNRDEADSYIKKIRTKMDRSRRTQGLAKGKARSSSSSSSTTAKTKDSDWKNLFGKLRDFEDKASKQRASSDEDDFEGNESDGDLE